MPDKLVWTEPRDARLKRLRSEGHTWDTIAVVLGVSRNAALERGRRIGARLPPPEHVPEPEDPERPPLPPGHPTTWGAIVAGTILEGAAYPLPAPWAAGPAPLPPTPTSAERARTALRSTATAEPGPLPELPA